ncbi:PQQ-dependent sugar dehydrogenase [Rhodocytophaga aerolata]|uniref:PQQ-dependent sugar dehydrogenase n=1 Tax=Rhodocytophaga aerolata TaxID=455078 RepID=A0ABT8R2E5_9BACT|nr:c-type cytochrome [Rhodocytophaga aerolata]MDO1444957.1 PQQ-dependent sugar dehydrogenase [Rhodocytophaga aerolata]
MQHIYLTYLKATSATGLFSRTFCWLLLLLFFSQCKEKVKLPPPSPDNGGLFLPGNFQAVVVADSLEGKARHIAVNDNGDVYVKARYGGADSSIIALRDTNNDGRADILKRFGGVGKERGYGTAVRIHKGYIYFSSELLVYRYKLTPGKLVPEGKMEIILTDDHAHGMHEHIAKPLSFDDQGNMYVPFGAPSNACQETNRTPNSPGIYPCPLLEDHAGIWRFSADKLHQTQRDGTKYATGLRSIVAMDWNQADKSLYVLNHGRDDLLRLWAHKYTPWQSAVLPSEEFFKVREGMDGGWPYFYYDQMQKKKVINPEYEGKAALAGKEKDLEQPIFGFPGHWAPNDVLFYTGTQFPERYREGAFVAFHGSTNRAPYPQASYFIGFIPFKNGKPTGEWEVFADGFAGVDPIVNVSDAHYRPMGIAMGPDGSLYIAETEKGKVWRIMYTGEKDTFGEPQLAQMEKRKSLSHLRTPDEVNDNLDKGVVVAGEKIYNTYCGSCHQRNGLGDNSRFPPLANSDWVVGDKNRLIEVVLNGLQGPIEVKGQSYNNVMPQHSFLGNEDIAQVLTYIRQNFGNTASAINADEVNKVRNALHVQNTSTTK